MIGRIIAVGRYHGRWMYVTGVKFDKVYGRIWKPSKSVWTKMPVWYLLDTIDKKMPPCPKPAPPKDV